jgi:hypothetical protein
MVTSPALRALSDIPGGTGNIRPVTRISSPAIIPLYLTFLIYSKLMLYSLVDV